MKLTDLSPVINKVIQKRDVSYNNLFDNEIHEPELLPNIGKLKKKLEEIKLWDGKIMICGDKDVDGITSAAIISNMLEYLEIDYETRIVDRHVEGYGLQKETVDMFPDADLILTLDNGITQDEAIEYAFEKGVDVFVIDHHLSNDTPTFDFIDLKVNQGYYPFKNLSAGGLCWKIAKYFMGDLADNLVGIAALSTVADLVGVLGENRAIIKKGLQKINNSPCVGVEALIDVIGIDEEITANTIGWNIAPVINAVGRLEHNQLCYALLMTDDSDLAYSLAEQAVSINEERRRLTKEGVKQVEDKEFEGNVIVEQLNIPQGITGIIASNLMQRHKKPVFLFNEDYNGSFRSIDPLDLSSIKNNIETHFKTIGGHQYAGGGKLKEDCLNDLKSKLIKLSDGLKYKTNDYDMELNPYTVNEEFMNELDKIRPFGIDFKEPTFKWELDKVKNINIYSDKHLAFKWYGLDCIAFNMSDKKDLLDKENIEIMYQPSWNYWRGRKNIQLIIKSIKESEE